MTRLLVLGRGLFAAGAVGLGAFFAYWTVVIWGNIADPSADNADFTYFVAGLLPAALTILFLGFAVGTIRGEWRRAGGMAAAAVAILIFGAFIGFFG